MATCPDREWRCANQIFVNFIDATPVRWHGGGIRPRSRRAPDSPVGARRYANIEGLSPWTKDKLSAEDYRRKEVVELNNGRLAMISLAGFVTQEVITGTELLGSA